MTTLPLIGLTGRKRSGKNAAADILTRAHGYEVAAFADPLRDLIAAIDPIVDEFDADNSCGDPDCCGGPFPYVVPLRYSDALERLGYEAAKDAHPEVRRILQATGTEGVREVLGTKYGLRDILGDDLWVVLADKRIGSAHLRTVVDPRERTETHHWRTPLAFTDVRFPNEADLIRRRGGIVVRVDRPSLPAPADLHPSETAMDDYAVDHTVTNDGTLTDLESAVLSLIP